MFISACVCVCVCGVFPTALSLGIELAGGKMSVIIPRNTTVPYKHTRVYFNNEDNQTKAVIEVYEGEDALTENNRYERICGHARTRTHTQAHTCTHSALALLSLLGNYFCLLYAFC